MFVDDQELSEEADIIAVFEIEAVKVRWEKIMFENETRYKVQVDPFVDFKLTFNSLFWTHNIRL